MTKFFLGLILGTLISIALADNISAPPPLADFPAAGQAYLHTIYENFNKLNVVTTNPDGSRNGKKGEMVLLQTGGNSFLEINSDSSTTWLGVQLTNTP